MNFPENASLLSPESPGENGPNAGNWQLGNQAYSYEEEEDGERVARFRRFQTSQHPKSDHSDEGLELCLSDDAFDFTSESESSVHYLHPRDPGFSESEGSVGAEKKRSRSNSSRHRYDVVAELGPEEVRWFYKEDKKTWKFFIGYDSLRLELAYRKYCILNPPKQEQVEENVDSCCLLETVSISIEPVCVRGGLYEVDIKEKDCYPVYWNQADKIPVMRGQWFVDGTWQPLEEEDSDLIEQEHLRCFKGQQMQDTFEMEVAKPIDSKDDMHF